LPEIETTPHRMLSFDREDPDVHSARGVPDNLFEPLSLLDNFDPMFVK